MTYNGNQLTKVTDAVTSATASGSMDFRDGANVATEYTYDANGNMTSDLNKGITNIQYNFLNLPSKVTFSNGGTVTYFYDATGRKLKVVHAKAGKVHTMEYVGNHIYEDGVLKQTLIEGGYLTYSGNTPAYHFYVKDHLGNNRMVMSASGAVEQVVHYYPYGMAFADGTNADAQRFKYNGKELDAEDGLNWMDYGARMYDAATGRWGGVDALAEKYNGMSPYNYCFNSPLNVIDPDGKDGYLVNAKGQINRISEDHELCDIGGAQYDVLFSQDAFDKGDYKKQITVSDPKLIPQLIEGNEDNIIMTDKKYVGGGELGRVGTTNDKVAYRLFKFLADNTNVEWGYQKYTDGSRAITTTYQESSTASGRSLEQNRGKTIAVDIHSHPSTTNKDMNPSQQDMSRMKNIVNDNRNAEVWLYIPKAKNPQCRMLDLVNWKWIDY